MCDKYRPALRYSTGTSIELDRRGGHARGGCRSTPLGRGSRPVLCIEYADSDAVYTMPICFHKSRIVFELGFLPRIKSGPDLRIWRSRSFAALGLSFLWSLQSVIEWKSHVNVGRNMVALLRPDEDKGGREYPVYVPRIVEELRSLLCLFVQLFHSSTSSMASQLIMVMAFNKLIRVPLWL